MAVSQADAVVIGGGFYGAAVAIYLAKQQGLKRIHLIERGDTLLGRASYNNQARIHNGYHYPRSFTTAYRSRINLPRFVQDWPETVKQDFTKIYAIARNNSKVTSRQFSRFCQQIGASLKPAPKDIKALFNPRLVEDAFLVEEYAFNSSLLADWARKELAECGVHIHLNTRATKVSHTEGGAGLTVEIQHASGTQAIACRYVMNCTYSGLNQLTGDFPGTRTDLKHEITEMALVQMPKALEGIGITMMDGPFFSAMPFPSRGLHTFSHVRYTPHMQWQDSTGDDPYARLDAYAKESRYERMVRDAARFMPALAGAEYADSLFEVKTVLVKNEGDDGRPILFEAHEHLPGCYSILGGKIDNIYDMLERLDDVFAQDPHNSEKQSKGRKRA